MLKTVERYIQRQRLLSPDATIIVGLSGGGDSMTLLDVLTLLGYKCIAAHCNFHLRAEESNRDAEFVKKWCKGIDVEFTSINFDTHQYAADKKISIEMAARELRYTWFEIIRKQYDAEAIAVAHHKDDSVETVLMNLLRGTGIKGLTGISPKNGAVVRPLLCISRQEIEEYLKERAIPHVFDSSNNDDVFLRNALRINIIPALEALNPSVKDAIYRTSQNMAETEKVYSRCMEQAASEVFSENKIDIRKLKNMVSPISLLFHILSPMGFTPSVIENISQSFDATSGKLFYGGAYRLLKDRNFFLLNTVSNESNTKETPFIIGEETNEIIALIHLRIRRTNRDESVIKKQSYLYVDADKISFPLTLRKWKAGDWFIPFGMRGRKKLSDYFTDRKFSITDKENAWVLVSDKDIVWIVGERSDDRFRITSQTKNVLVIEVIQKNGH